MLRLFKKPQGAVALLDFELSFFVDGDETQWLPFAEAVLRQQDPAAEVERLNPGWRARVRGAVPAAPPTPAVAHRFELDGHAHPENSGPGQTHWVFELKATAGNEPPAFQREIDVDGVVAAFAMQWPGARRLDARIRGSYVLRRTKWQPLTSNKPRTIGPKGERVKLRSEIASWQVEPAFRGIDRYAEEVLEIDSGFVVSTRASKQLDISPTMIADAENDLWNALWPLLKKTPSKKRP